MPPQQSLTANGTGISYRNLPLPRYHLDPVLENGSGSGPVSNLAESTMTSFNGSGGTSRLHQHFSSGHDLRYHDDRDRHNDSGYSTRPGESSQGPSPSLSGASLFSLSFIRWIDQDERDDCQTTGPAESMEGDPILMMSPQSARRAEHFQSHFARDLAQSLPTSKGYLVQPGAVAAAAAASSSSSSGNGPVAYPRVRFAVPNSDVHEDALNLFPPGTISSSSLV